MGIKRTDDSNSSKAIAFTNIYYMYQDNGEFKEYSMNGAPVRPNQEDDYRYKQLAEILGEGKHLFFCEEKGIGFLIEHKVVGSSQPADESKVKSSGFTMAELKAAAANR